MKNKISQWKDIVGHQSLDAYLDEHFGDKKKFRVSRKRCRASEKFVGGMLSGMCYVLYGRCLYIIGGSQFELMGGDFCELPEGRYSFECNDEFGCEVVLVWKIQKDI
jgi:hypothetical protein